MKIYCLFCFVFYLRFKECVLESNNKETIYLCFFHFVDMIFEWNIQFSPVRFNGWLIWMLYKYNIYRPLNYTLRMMINNNIFFFVMIPFYIYLLGSRLYGYILIVILLFFSVLCHVIKSGKSGNFQIFLLM